MKAAKLKWVDFDDGWFDFWRTVDKTPFAYTHVNGRCAYVTHVFHEFLEAGEEQYGWFLGEITNSHWAKGPFTRHGWLLNQGIIIDPTRWCFLENRLHRPQLALCPEDSPDYDQGMNKMRAAQREPMPPYTPSLKVKCKHERLLGLFGGQICKNRIFWLAHLTPKDPVFINEFDRKNMYGWLQKNGFAAWIPWDNQIKLEN